MSVKPEPTKRRLTKRAKSSASKCMRKQAKRVMPAPISDPAVALPPTATEGEESQRLCWICYGDDEDSRDWLSPCRCSGSMKWAHQHCLLTWVNQMEVRCREIMCPQCLYNYRLTGGPWIIEQHMKRCIECMHDLFELVEMITVLAMKTKFVKRYLWYVLIAVYTVEMIRNSDQGNQISMSAIHPAPFLMSAIVGLARVTPVRQRFPPRGYGIGRDNPYMDEATFFSTYGILLGCSMAAVVSVVDTGLRERTGLLYFPYIVLIFSVVTRIFLYFYKKDIQPRFVLNFGEEPPVQRGFFSVQ